METYKIIDVFRTLQGEGYYSGTDSLFIRFYGCNLACPFCDEPTHKNSKRIIWESESIADTQRFILDKWEELSTPGNRPKLFVFTGGEPSIYPIDSIAISLRDIIRNREDIKTICSIETNGYNPENFNCFDHITFSPKNDYKLEEKLIYIVNSPDAIVDIKCLWGENEASKNLVRKTFDTLDEILAADNILRFNHAIINAWVSPINKVNTINHSSYLVKEVIDYIQNQKYQNFEVRMNCQMHKVYNFK